MTACFTSANAISPRLPVSGCSSRRRFLEQAGGGFGAVALAALLAGHQAGDVAVAEESVSGRSVNPLAPRQSHFRPRARRVIWLFMHGGPSHVDLFDPKPELTRLAGKTFVALFPILMPTICTLNRGSRMYSDVESLDRV